MQQETMATAILIIAPLIVLMGLFVRFSSVVFDVNKEKKKPNRDVSIIRFTFFILLFASPYSIPFYTPFF